MTTDAGVVDDDGVVRVGSVVFALIRPTAGHDAPFNHWYERDHYYTTGLAAPGVFSAGRFVEPAERLHCALYFVLPGFDAERVAFATEQVVAANDSGRAFTDREHLHTWRYEPVEAWTTGVPLALALDHRYAALSVVLLDRGEPVASLIEESNDDTIAAALLMAPEDPIMPSSWDSEWGLPEARDDRRLLLAFHSEAGGSAPAVDAARWSAQMVPMVFGTDTHITP